jgi:guanine nucleotide-binding protein G(i) subunit alpha
MKARTFWEDSTIQKAILNPKNSNYSEYSVSLKYIMDNWDRLTDADWSPTPEDLLMLRARTSGFMETNVQVKDWIWKLIDVGGQRVERKKWPAITAGLNGILFFASLNDYDAEAEVPNMKTRMHESLAVWREVLLSEDASHAPIILFLNKKDLFEKRITECPIQDSWPDFEPRTDGNLFNAGVTFIMNKYLQLLNDPSCRVQAEFVYVHVTCALDTDQMRVVSTSIRDFVVQQRLKLVEGM